MTQTRAFTLPLLVAFFAIAADAAYAQVSMRVRGTITGLEGNVLSVKTREGKDLQLRLSDKTAVVAAKAMKLEDLKAGDYVGTTTQARADGALVVTNVPADRSALKPGEYIFTVAAVAADGTMTVQRIQVSRDGVQPPQ